MVVPIEKRVSISTLPHRPLLALLVGGELRPRPMVVLAHTPRAAGHSQKREGIHVMLTPLWNFIFTKMAREPLARAASGSPAQLRPERRRRSRSNLRYAVLIQSPRTSPDARKRI